MRSDAVHPEAAVSVDGVDGQTRSAVVSLLVEDGPLTASEIAERLGISAAGVRRHLEALSAAGDVEAAARVYARAGAGQRGRGRPARRFQLTAAGRGKLRHAYDDLAGAAMRKLREVGGPDAVAAFARERADRIVADVPAATTPESVADTADAIADALTGAGYATNTRAVGAGVQICQHHCPVAHVATAFPELCEAETAVFTELLGTHVQRLATIANGDCACTTHVPLHPVPTSDSDDASEPGSAPAPAAARTPADAQPASSGGTTSRKVSR
ncbi:transcriptional regulator [Gordonia sinesedis]